MGSGWSSLNFVLKSDQQNKQIKCECEELVVAFWRFDRLEQNYFLSFQVGSLTSLSLRVTKKRMGCDVESGQEGIKDGAGLRGLAGPAIPWCRRSFYLWAAALASSTALECIHERTANGSSFRLAVEPRGSPSWIPNIPQDPQPDLDGEEADGESKRKEECPAGKLEHWSSIVSSGSWQKYPRGRGKMLCRLAGILLFSFSFFTFQRRPWEEI